MANTDSGLVHVGAHCALASCNVNDFLPIRCKCDQLFCRDHIAPDAHSCSLLAQHNQASDGPSSSKLQRCPAQSCTKPSLESYIADAQDTTSRSPALCPGCKQAFCAEYASTCLRRPCRSLPYEPTLRHREPKSHSCAPPEPTQSAPQKNAAAKALLAKHFAAPNTSTGGASRPASSSPRPKKLAQQRQVAVMKMRHKARPVDPKDATAAVAMNERLHVKVRRAEEDPSLERILWFRKSVWTGRALDMLASQFQMSISDSQPLKLLHVNDEGDSVALRNDQPLADQVHDGASLVLSR